MADARARGQDSDDPRAAQAEAATQVFDRLRRSLKQIALYRHNVDRYSEYLEPFTSAMMDMLSVHPMLSLKLDAMAYKLGPFVVFEDDSRDNNIIFPLWSVGVRLLVFKQGVTADELQRFFLLCLGAGDSEKKGREDISTLLWKAELTSIE